jgi:D-serine deaminase-like pyridoxal phosphate-dependent protein
VAGGTPTFPAHALRADVESSPGTCLFWDYNYASKFKDLDFLWAAVLVTRVVSRPAADILCLDLGYKAVSPDNPKPRVHLLDLPGAEQVVHNEEHLALRTQDAGRYRVGDVLYGVPFHVCPTVALHRDVYVVEDNRVTGRWQVAARDRVLTI